MAPTSLTMSLTLWLPLGMDGAEMAWTVSSLLSSSTSSAQELVAGLANLGLLRDFS